MSIATTSYHKLYKNSKHDTKKYIYAYQNFEIFHDITNKVEKIVIFHIFISRNADRALTIHQELSIHQAEI